MEGALDQQFELRRWSYNSCSVRGLFIRCEPGGGVVSFPQTHLVAASRRPYNGVQKAKIVCVFVTSYVRARLGKKRMSDRIP